MLVLFNDFGWALPALALLAIAGCGGSSASPGELRTPAQASAFVASVARGESLAKWKAPVAGASSEATQAWAHQAALRDLGERLRREGRLACETTEDAVTLGAFGQFNENDRGGILRVAKDKGVTTAKIVPLLNDAGTVGNHDLSVAKKAVCG